MPTDRARRGMTDAEVEAAFQAVPDTMVGEIIDGELHTNPRPATLQTRVWRFVPRAAG